MLAVANDWLLVQLTELGLQLFWVSSLQLHQSAKALPHKHTTHWPLVLYTPVSQGSPSQTHHSLATGSLHTSQPRLSLTNTPLTGHWFSTHQSAKALPHKHTTHWPLVLYTPVSQGSPSQTHHSLATGSLHTSQPRLSLTNTTLTGHWFSTHQSAKALPHKHTTHWPLVLYTPVSQGSPSQTHHSLATGSLHTHTGREAGRQGGREAGRQAGRGGGCATHSSGQLD